MIETEYFFPIAFEPFMIDRVSHPDLTLQRFHDMTKEEAWDLFHWGKNINITQLVYSIILAATKERWTETRGVREFWYNPVKPIVYRLGGDTRELDEKDLDRVLSEKISELVKSGLITYKQLGIVDYRTQRMLYESIDRAECWKDVILFVEKDSAYVHLRPLKELLNITLASGGGVSKTACAEDLTNKLEPGHEYRIFTVVDYDPYGTFIGEEFVQKLQLMGLNVEHIRIAINPDQLDSDLTQTTIPHKNGEKGVDGGALV